MTIPLDHPVVREAAEVMAREFVLMQREVAGTSAFTSTDVTVHARLLTDLSRPASRDWWVRWGATRDCAANSSEWCERVTDTTVPADVVRRWVDNDHRLIRDMWLARRDNPTALTAAVLAALEGK
jgi:hypothetical protein